MCRRRIARIALMRRTARTRFSWPWGLCVHVPLVAPAAYFDASRAGAMALPCGDRGRLGGYSPAGITKNSVNGGLVTVEKKRQVLSAYHAVVAFMDAQVGRILGELDALGLRERPSWCSTSDHGYHLGEHEFWQKMSLREESARIPLIVAAPGVKRR